MAYEKRFKAVPPQSLTSNGEINGRLTILDSKLFKVKQLITLLAPTLAHIDLEIKRIDDINTMYVGPIGGSIDSRTDISQYTTALSAAIFANEQLRTNVPEQAVERLTYEEEPTVARRVTLVDALGDKYGLDNPLPVNATVSTSNVGTPTIFNVLASIKGDEYSQVLPNNTGQFLLKARNSAKLQISFISGTTGTNYLTVYPGSIYKVESVKITGKTVYFQSSKDGTDVEIIVWT